MSKSECKIINFPGVETVSKKEKTAHIKTTKSTRGNKGKSVQKKTKKLKKLKKIKILCLIIKKILSLKPVKRILSFCIVVLAITSIAINGIKDGSKTIAVEKNLSFEETLQNNISALSENVANTMQNATTREDLSVSLSTDKSIAESTDEIKVELTSQLEGEKCAYYLAQIAATLPAESLEYDSDGNVSYNTKEISFEVIDVVPDMTEEQLLLLPQDILEDIYEEAEKLSSKVKKELKKSKGKDYFAEKIDEELKKLN